LGNRVRDHWRGHVGLAATARRAWQSIHGACRRFVALRSPPGDASDTITALAQPAPECLMNPFSLVTRPVQDLLQALVMPFRALFVIGLTGTINYMTYSGVWWFKWVALGMGIAVLVAWARAAKTLLLLALVAWVGMKIYQRYGVAARQTFDDWVAKTQPQAAQVLQALRQPQAMGSAGAAGSSSG
jgi:hypothetical protein